MVLSRRVSPRQLASDERLEGWFASSDTTARRGLLLRRPHRKRFAEHAAFFHHVSDRTVHKGIGFVTSIKSQSVIDPRLEPQRMRTAILRLQPQVSKVCVRQMKEFEEHAQLDVSDIFLVQYSEEPLESVAVLHGVAFHPKLQDEIVQDLFSTSFRPGE
jgi:hypothetical protein